MTMREVLAILLRIVGVAAPVFALYAAFGPTARVQPDSLPQLAALAGSGIFAFVLGLLAGAVSRRSSPPDPVSILRAMRPDAD